MFLGKVMSVPVTDQFASKVNKNDISDPVHIADMLKSNEYIRKDKFPRKELFGTTRVLSRPELPIEHRELYNLSYKGGEAQKLNNIKTTIKTYNQNNKLQWMDASIDISQPEIKRFIFNNKSQERDINKSHLNAKLEDIFNQRIGNNEVEKNCYEYLSTISQKNKVGDLNNLRRSRVLQSIGENKMSTSQRSDLNRSVIDDMKYVQKFNPDLSTFGAGTIKTNRGKTEIKIQYLGPSGAKHNTTVYQETRRFIRQYDKPLKEKYYEKVGYINAPINQVKVPEISSNKRSF